jgi:hypothetical protein
MIKWFDAGLLSLNSDKPYSMEFHSKYTTTSEMQIIYNDKITSNTTELNFLGFYPLHSVSNSHID